MAWAIPRYSRSSVDKAASTLFHPDVTRITSERIDECYEIIDNWRASHAYPLNNFQVNLRSKFRRIQANDILVAQRIKRLESIEAKLTRSATSTMKLSQMQDIGGCRAIMRTIDSVAKLIASYERSNFNHVLRGHKDYIASPKPDGYRGHHLIYEYRSLPNQKKEYDGLLIEIQIRTRLQHAWATTVEAVGTFTKQALKANQGSDDWLRFFCLMANAISMIEGTAGVPACPDRPDELSLEIADLSRKLRASQVLDSYAKTLKYVGAERKDIVYYLVRLSPGSGKTFVTGFRRDQSEIANVQYTKVEKDLRVSEGEQAVLVSVDSIKTLRRAYPNYFLDTTSFGGLLDRVVSSAVVADWGRHRPS